ncbi:MAG: hypothetical protein EXS67_01705 [Candidatus Margulisbacteria bacterium]|nr:hypothetical protein [Candidatus Margulisiibacteriota bacterium]
MSFLRHLNLDTVLGSLGSALLACQIVGVSMHWSWWGALSLSVFGIYSLDRVLDAKEDSHSARHRFHYTHRHLFLLLSLVGFTCVFILAILFFSKPLLFASLCLGLFALLHVAIARFRWYGFIKEIVIAFLYTGGIFLGPLLSMQSRSIPFGAIVYFFGIVLLSLWCYTYLDDVVDRLDSLPSLSFWIGAKRVRFLGLCLWFSLILVGLLCSYRGLLLMAVCTGGMLCFSSRFRISDRYRIYGEFVFIIPLGIKLIHRSIS